MCGSSRVNVLAGLVGSDEGHTLDVGVRADLSHGIAATLDNVDNAIRDTCLLEKVNKNLSGAGNALRGLEHVSVSERDAEREHPQGDHSREVVGSDSSHNTERSAVRVDIDASGDALSRLTLSEGAEAAGVLDDLVTTENVASGISEGLAVLLSDHSRDFTRVFLKESLVLEHVADTCRDGSLRPGLESIFGVGHGFVELTLGRDGHLSDDILSEGAPHIKALGGFGFNPSAVDVVFVLLE